MFASSGYAATRLEDVAEAVGLTTRAALFYYFADKQTLYDATLENAFGSLASHLDEALSTPGTIPQRIERAVEAWIDAIVARPTLGRLILRYVADAKNARRSASTPQASGFFASTGGSSSRAVRAESSSQPTTTLFTPPAPSLEPRCSTSLPWRR